MAGGNSGSHGKYNSEGNKLYDAMNLEKQNRHIPGTKEFDSSKSTIDIPISELDQLIRENIDKAVRLPSGKMVLTLPKDVGTWKSQDGKTSHKTNRITLHKSKTGYHAVPAQRDDKKGGNR